MGLVRGPTCPMYCTYSTYLSTYKHTESLYVISTEQRAKQRIPGHILQVALITWQTFPGKNVLVCVDAILVPGCASQPLMTMGNNKPVQ